MENLVETVSLDMDETNDLTFKVSVEGAAAPAKVRLVCESDEVAYMFKGRLLSDDVIQFTIPSMKGKLTEGNYRARVEVLVENRYFAPVEFELAFKNPVKVFAEAVKISRPSPEKEVKVTAALMPSPRQDAPAPPEPPVVEAKHRISARTKSSFDLKPIDDAGSIRDLVRGILSASSKKNRD